MKDWKEALTAAAKWCIETEKKCRANPCGWQSCGPRDTPEWKEYAILSEAWQQAEADLWRVTDIEFSDDPLRAAVWEWRYWKVMSRKCTWYMKTAGNSKRASETMQALRLAETHMMKLCGLEEFYKSPNQYIEEAFPKLKMTV